MGAQSVSLVRRRRKAAALTACLRHILAEVRLEGYELAALHLELAAQAIEQGEGAEEPTPEGGD